MQLHLVIYLIIYVQPKNMKTIDFYVKSIPNSFIKSFKMSCEEAVDLYLVKKSANQEKFKLLQQAHCGKCWRPLIYNTTWPGSHENQRPPYHSTLRTPISVSQCGHIFHTPCAMLITHCAICQVIFLRYFSIIKIYD